MISERRRRHLDLATWIDSLKSHADEKISWFVDDFDFNNKDFPTLLFQQLTNGDTVFMVNHSKLMNIMQLFYEWLLSENDLGVTHTPDKAFFLASAVRFVNERDLKPVATDSYARGA